MSGVNVPLHFAQQFATNVELLLQQKGSRLRDKVLMGSHKGEQASPVDQVGAVEMLPVNERFGEMPRVDAPLDRRWCLPSDFHLPQLVDSFDELRLITDPKSKFVENAVLAAGRQIDRILLAAMFGDAKTGKTGSTTTTFLAGNVIAVAFGSAGDSGVTVAKLREAKRILMSHNVDLETDPIYAALTALGHDNLLAEAQVVSTDFNDRPVLVDGKLTRFLGINFVHTELLPTVAGDTQCPVWAKSGMHLGIWGDIKTSVSQRHDLTSEPWQAYVKMTMGATRIEEKKVVNLIANV